MSPDTVTVPNLPRRGTAAPRPPATALPPPVPARSRAALVTAIQQQVPQRWLGETEREAGYMGVPDRKGHRERMRGSSR